MPLRCHRCLTVLALLAATPAAAQEVAGRALSLSAGSRLYEGGAALGLVAAVRAEYPVARTFLLEAAGSVADPVEGIFGSTTAAFEVQAQAQLPGRRLAPYAGLGAGAGHVQRNLDDEGSVGAFLSGGGGVRVGFGRELGLVVDGRIRVPFADGADIHGDVTLGLRYRFR
jgi:hypothetical protein